MRYDLRRHSRPIGIASLIVLSIALGFLPGGIADRARSVALSVFSPAQKLFYRLGTALAGMHNWFTSRAELLREKEELASKLRQVEDLLIQKQDELRKERLRVVAVGSFKELAGADNFTPVVEAEVIGRDPSKLRESVVIDRGSADGLAAGMPVVWGQALIGKLAAVGPWASRVQLLTDAEFKVSCYLGESGARGLAEGASKHGLTMSYIGGKVKVAPGEMVLSSGEGGIFPKGLIVGQVTQVKPAGLFQVVHLRPRAELDRLEMVLVLVRKKRSVELGSQPK